MHEPDVAHLCCSYPRTAACPPSHPVALRISLCVVLNKQVTADHVFSSSVWPVDVEAMLPLGILLIISDAHSVMKIDKGTSRLVRASYHRSDTFNFKFSVLFLMFKCRPLYLSEYSTKYS